MSLANDDFAQAVEVQPGRYYFTALRRLDSLKTSHIAASSICYTIDDELLYEPFFADFGPLNLGRTYRFVKKTQELLQEAERQKKRCYFFCGPHANYKANAAVLVGIFQVLYLNRTADEAYKPLLAFKPYVPFRDASCGISSFHLTVLDVLRGVQKARDAGFIDWNSGSSTWSLEEYEHYEQVENGDLNWILPGKLVAFSGPAARGNEIAGYRLHTPEDYWDYYKRKNVTAVIRLNKKVYDRKRFTDGGFRHYDMYFPDGSCPTEAILLRFLEVVENEPGACAVHCKAGLGRTGVLICCYIMKHFKFTAEEVIGYIRVCRPGSVIGPQQNFLREVEARMWQEGELYRHARGIHKPQLGLQDLSISGKAAPTEQLDAYAAPRAGSAAAYSMAGAVRPARSDSAFSMNSQEYKGAPMPSSLNHYGAQPAATPPALAPAGMYGGYSSAASRGALRQQPQGMLASRSITPMRYTSGLTYGSPYGSGVGAGGGGFPGASPINPSAAAMPGQGGLSPPTSPTTPSGQAQPSMSALGSAVTRSMPAMARAPSADRAMERAAPSSLRATLHTDTLRAADRPRGALPERSAQSAEVALGWAAAGLRAAGRSVAQPVGPSVPISTTPKPTAAGHRPAVARTLAPNGQPRKVPISMLPQQYHAGMANQRPSAATPSSGPGGPDIARQRAVAQLRYGLHSK